MNKLLSAILTFVLLSSFLATTNVSYAATITDSFCQLTDGEPPAPGQLICPFLRIYNALILVVGVVLIIMIAVGGIKLSMSLGDPKGYQMASKTWTYTLWGLAIVLSSFFVLRLLDSMLGLGLNLVGPASLFEVILCKINALLIFAFIDTGGPVC